VYRDSCSSSKNYTFQSCDSTAIAATATKERRKGERKEERKTKKKISPAKKEF